MLKQLYNAVVISHDRQRYPTTGDWTFTPDGLLVSVSHMHNDDYEFLVAIHETIEAWLCKKHGIKDEDVCAFDEAYEERRAYAAEMGYLGANPGYLSGTLVRDFSCRCNVTEISEPGDDIHAPYYKQHQIATGVERILAAELGVSWNEYEAANLKLYENEKRENE